MAPKMVRVYYEFMGEADAQTPKHIFVNSQASGVECTIVVWSSHALQYKEYSKITNNISMFLFQMSVPQEENKVFESAPTIINDMFN